MTKARQNETPPGPPTAADRSWKTEEESDATNPNPLSVDVLDARLDAAKPQRRVFAKEDASFSDGLMAARYAGAAHAPPAPHRDKTAPIDNVIVEATPVPDIPSRNATTDVPDVHELLQGTMLTPPAPQSRAAAPDSEPRPALLASRHDKTVLGPRAESRRRNLALIALVCAVLGGVVVAAFVATGRRAADPTPASSAPTTSAAATTSAPATTAAPPTSQAAPPATQPTQASPTVQSTAGTPTTTAAPASARPSGSQAPKGAASGPGLTKGDVPWTID